MREPGAKVAGGVCGDAGGAAQRQHADEDEKANKEACGGSVLECTH